MVPLLGTAIIISGVPGTGKTTVSKTLAEKIKAQHLNLSEISFRKGFIKMKDPDRDTYIIDEERLRTYIEGIIRETEGVVIIDSHYGEFIEDNLVTKIFVLRLEPGELLKRLTERGYPPKKIKENLEAEIVGSCTYNAVMSHPREKVCEIDATGKTAEEIVNIILDILQGKRECVVGIDWSSRGILDQVLDFIIKDG